MRTKLGVETPQKPQAHNLARVANLFWYLSSGSRIGAFRLP